MALNRGVLTIILGLSLSAATSLTAADATFPTLEAADLNNGKKQLPRGLAGEWNALLIGFQREQQTEIDTWLPKFPPLVAKRPSLAYYELPVIERTNPLLRWVIQRGMRGGIPDKQQRDRTITLYLDKKAFRETLRIQSEDRICVLLVNRAGEVLWRTEGPATPDKVQSLEAFLDGH
jgi:hypothetical protein